MKTLAAILVASVAAVFGGIVESHPSVEQANVVVIVVDQLSEWAANPATRAPLDMPNLDALASQGTTYTRCYATSPVCAANRLALLTGQYPFTLGTDKLDPGVGTLGTILTAAGWDTGYVGKWHLSPIADPSGYVSPSDRPGWRYFAGNEGQPHRYVTGWSFKQDTGNAVSTASWESAWNVGEAARFINANRSTPYALVVNYGPPHPTVDHALMPPLTIQTSEVVLRPNVAPADALLATAKYAKYLSACALTDADIGSLLAEIDFATTFVVLTADHGDMLYSHGAAGNQQKRRPYEEAAHVPLIIAGPGISPGVTDARLIGAVDILPSILSLIGVVVPSDVQGCRFPSMSPVYFGQDDASSSWMGQRWRGLVVGDVKYVITENGFEALFDLTADPYEQDNLAPNPIYLPTLLAFRQNTVAKAAEIQDLFFE